MLADFLDTFRTPMNRAKALKCLTQFLTSGGKTYMVHFFVEEKIGAGGKTRVISETTSRKVRGERIETMKMTQVIQMPDETYFILDTKTAYAYTQHLEAAH